MKKHTFETNILYFTRACKHWHSDLSYLTLNLPNSSYRIIDELMPSTCFDFVTYPVTEREIKITTLFMINESLQSVPQSFWLTYSVLMTAELHHYITPCTAVPFD